MMRFFSERITKTIAGILLSSVMLSTCAFALVPQPAHAQMAVFDPTNWVENKVSALMNSLSAATLKTLGLKEWTLDGVLFALAKKALQQVVRSTIDWINSGFKGSPMYITNPEQFFMTAADDLAGEIIYGSSLRALCSSADIRVSLEFYYRQSRYGNPQCSISSVVRNVDQFMQGNFLAGGWPGWLSTSINPVNQPLGGMIAGGIRVEGSLATMLGLKRDELSWGKGFLSYKECSDPNDPKTCKIVTPGSTIADALTFQLSIGERTLIEADEINELIGALFAQLGKEALTSLRGVAGLSQPRYNFSSGGGGGGFTPSYCDTLSYLEQLEDPICNPDPGGFGTSTATSTAVGSLVAEAIRHETNYQRMYEIVADRALSVAEEAAEKDLSCEQNRSISEGALDIHDDAADRVASSTGVIAYLRDIDLRFEEGDADDRAYALSEYIALQGSGVLHSEVTNTLEEQRTDDLRDDLAEMRSRIERCDPDDDDTTS